MVDEIERAGHCPKLCNPLEAKRRRGLTDKTDKLDARGLAILLRNGTLPEVWIPPASCAISANCFAPGSPRFVSIKERGSCETRWAPTCDFYHFFIFGARCPIDPAGEREHDTWSTERPWFCRCCDKIRPRHLARDVCLQARADVRSHGGEIWIPCS